MTVPATPRASAPRPRRGTSAGTRLVPGDAPRPLPAAGGTRSLLSEARVRGGLSVAQLARAIGVSRPSVALWEQGQRRPARIYWTALAAALGLTVEQVGELFVGYRPARFDSWPLPSLAVARRTAGLTQRQLAGRLGVAPTTLSMWESAGMPVPVDAIAELAHLLDTSEDRLRSAPPCDRVQDPRPLRQARRQVAMSQREAAAYLGVAVGSLARYESGERPPPLNVVRAMAVAYRRPLADLLRHSGHDIPPLPSGPCWRPEQVPQAILALRSAAGMTKTQLGRKLGRSGQAVRSWEVGRSRPTQATCRRLELLFPVSRGRFPR